jgi:hypothetical protein
VAQSAGRRARRGGQFTLRRALSRPRRAQEDSRDDGTLVRRPAASAWPLPYDPGSSLSTHSARHCIEWRSAKQPLARTSKGSPALARDRCCTSLNELQLRRQHHQVHGAASPGCLELERHLAGGIALHGPRLACSTCSPIACICWASSCPIAVALEWLRLPPTSAGRPTGDCLAIADATCMMRCWEAVRHRCPQRAARGLIGVGPLPSGKRCGHQVVW